MKISIAVIERRARFGMSIVSVALVLGLIAYNAGLISHQASYKPDHWYQSSDHGSYIVMREFQDESLCRKAEGAPAGCRSGKALTEQARSEATSLTIK